MFFSWLSVSSRIKPSGVLVPVMSWIRKPPLKSWLFLSSVWRTPPDNNQRSSSWYSPLRKTARVLDSALFSNLKKLVWVTALGTIVVLRVCRRVDGEARNRTDNPLQQLLAACHRDEAEERRGCCGPPHRHPEIAKWKKKFVNGASL